MLSGISSRELTPRSARSGRRSAPPAGRACRDDGPPAGRNGRPSALPAGRAGRLRGPAGRDGRSALRSQARSPVRLPDRLPDRGAASGREPAPRGPGRRWLLVRPADAPSAALRAGRRPWLSPPPSPGERLLVGATGPLAASGRRDRPGARAPVVPPRVPVVPPRVPVVPLRVRSLAGLPGRAADRVPRAAPDGSPPDDPYRRAAPPASRFRSAAVRRPAPPGPLRPVPVRRATPPVSLRSAAGLRPTPPVPPRPVPVVAFRVAAGFRPAPPVPLRPVPPLLAWPARPVLLRGARDDAWPAAREPVRRVPPARSGLPADRSRPCSPVTLSSAPTTQLPGTTVPGTTVPGNTVPDNAVEAAPGWERPQQKMSGGVLLSHAVPHAVPSALKSLTSGFGMEPGVSPSPWPPKHYGDVRPIPGGGN
jgi:hypothetical protein